MGNLSIRGLDAKALAALKRRAVEEDSSVNAVVLRLVEQALGLRPSKPERARHDDLDALAGCWQKQDGANFDAATAGFSKIDADMWK